MATVLKNIHREMNCPAEYDDYFFGTTFGEFWVRKTDNGMWKAFLKTEYGEEKIWEDEKLYGSSKEAMSACEEHDKEVCEIMER